MGLTTFDQTFDHSFARAVVDIPVVLPPVGGDLPVNLSTGTHVSGSAIPFSTDPALLPSCRNWTGQGWERWDGAVGALNDVVLPFMLAVPKPANLSTSPYCTSPLYILDAGTGAVVFTTRNVLNRITDDTTLYIVYPGGVIDVQGQQQSLLPAGAYRLQVGPSVSDVFVVRPAVCGLLVRLSNPTRLGNLLYGSYGFEQRFYVDGDLSGPVYEESSTKSGDEKTSGKVTKTFVLSVSGVSESVADALALASLHRTVEIGVPGPAGSIVRAVQAMPYQASAKISQGGTVGFDVELSLPVSVTSWSSAATSGAGCVSVGSGTGSLLALDCGTPTGPNNPPPILTF